ncbi:MAG: hypothetical protein K2X47_12975 [Bdellovibrionales bacterium]|nr:hypothetical protein [Bdellovibrionales bacterium]
MKSSAFALSIALFCLPSTSHAEEKPKDWLVHIVSNLDAPTCQALVDQARLRLERAQKTFGIPAGTVAVGVDYDPAPNAAPLSFCANDGASYFRPGCGMPDYLSASECRLIFASENKEWSYRLVQTEKKLGKTQNALCRAEQAALSENPLLLFVEIQDGGFLKTHCRNNVVELVQNKEAK